MLLTNGSRAFFDGGRSDETFYKAAKSCCEQTPGIYGLAKVQKQNIPVRPILPLPGFWSSTLTGLLASYLSKLPDCNIKVNPKTVDSGVASAELPEGFELAPFDVSSLFTRVPVQE